MTKTAIRYGHGDRRSRLRTGAAMAPTTSPTKDRDFSDPHVFAAQYRTELQQWSGFSLPTQPRR